MSFKEELEQAISAWGHAMYWFGKDDSIPEENENNYGAQ